MVEVVKTLSPAQQKEFQTFIQRNKYRKNRKDLQLFNLLKDGVKKSPEEMVKLLKTSNINAYHTIRKRLFEHLADFIILKSTTDDAGPESHVNNLLGVVNYLFDKNLNKHGWKYLLLAENLASQHHFYTALNSIYLLQIDKIEHQDSSEILLEEVIDKYQENQKVLRQEEKLKIASSLIKQKLSEAREQGAEVNYHELITANLEKLQINNEVLLSPRIMLNFVKIIRKGIMAQKDFYQFEDFLIKNFEHIYAGRKEVPEPTIMFEFLYFIAHALYRNKKFEASISYLTKMERLIESCPRNFQRKHRPVYIQLLSANYAMTKEIELAIKNLNTLKEELTTLTNEVALNTIVSLGIYHFLNQDYKESQALLNQLNHSDRWYRKTMGVEWVLKKNIMEIILFAELGHIELVESRIRSIERTFSPLKSNTLYQRAFVYINLIKRYFLNYHEDSERLKTEIESKIEFLPYEREDIQAMAFYSWLKSKAYQKDFYETLLDVVA